MEEAKFKMGKAEFNKLEQDYYDLLSSWLINILSYTIDLLWIFLYIPDYLKAINIT
jgi:hypothetical protein